MLRAGADYGQAGPVRRSATRSPHPERLLFRRLFVINALVFTIGTLVLAISPATVSAPVVWTEIPVLLIGLSVILLANAVLIRSSLAPLGALADLMARVDPLRRGDRLVERGNGDLTELIGTFNAMLERLETERAASTAQALAAQEGERERIARELHDEIGQGLTVVLLGLRRVADQVPAGLQPEVEAVAETVRHNLDEVRQVAKRLRPGVLADLGLRSALKALTRDLSAAGVPVTTDLADELPEMSREVELVVYRVAQEALTNVARHANATSVQVSLTATDPGSVTLRISDDGVGMGPIESAGIRGMRERAMLIRSRLRVESRPRAGTEVTLVIDEPTMRS